MTRDEDAGDDPSPVRRIIQSASIGLVLTAPMLLGIVPVATGAARAGAVTELLGWMYAFSTGILALPWLLFTLVFAGSGDVSPFFAIALGVAFAINASLALRRFRFGRLLLIASLVAFAQCCAVAAML